MKVSCDYVAKTRVSLPRIEFQDQRLTNFAGLVIFQALIQKLDLRKRLQNCFKSVIISPIYKIGN